jgi:hypothetical protein
MLCNSAVDNFYLSDEELADSPSRKDGTSEEQEITLRAYGAQLVQEAGILLRCPQAVMATAQVLLQRFYCKRSLKAYNVQVRPGRIHGFKQHGLPCSLCLLAYSLQPMCVTIRGWRQL